MRIFSAFFVRIHSQLLYLQAVALFLCSPNHYANRVLFRKYGVCNPAKMALCSAFFGSVGITIKVFWV